MCLSLSADILIFVICMMIAVTILLLASMGSGWGIPCERILPSAMIDYIRHAPMALSVPSDRQTAMTIRRRHFWMP